MWKGSSYIRKFKIERQLKLKKISRDQNGRIRSSGLKSCKMKKAYGIGGVVRSVGQWWRDKLGTAAKNQRSSLLEKSWGLLPCYLVPSMRCDTGTGGAATAARGLVTTCQPNVISVGHSKFLVLRGIFRSYGTIGIHGKAVLKKVFWI